MEWGGWERPTFANGANNLLSHSVATVHVQMATSLVSRLPRSGTRTLKLCRHGEPGIFCHVKSAKDRREVDATLIVRGRMRLNRSRNEGSGQLTTHI